MYRSSPFRSTFNTGYITSQRLRNLRGGRLKRSGGKKNKNGRRIGKTLPCATLRCGSNKCLNLCNLPQVDSSLFLHLCLRPKTGSPLACKLDLDLFEHGLPQPKGVCVCVCLCVCVCTKRAAAKLPSWQLFLSQRKIEKFKTDQNGGKKKRETKKHK